MYHYYVRFSIYSDHKKIGDGSTEIIKMVEISKMSHIEEIKEEILSRIKKLYNLKIDKIELDFYQLLRKDPD